MRNTTAALSTLLPVAGRSEQRETLAVFFPACRPPACCRQGQAGVHSHTPHSWQAVPNSASDSSCGVRVYCRPPRLVFDHFTTSCMPWVEWCTSFILPTRPATGKNVLRSCLLVLDTLASHTAIRSICSGCFSAILRTSALRVTDAIWSRIELILRSQ